ncbi:MAG TPA: hypothetical protein VNR68_11170 [Sphingomicrobium sp.]|nr:hypothetical protein [Sphingomicrobium sp.]
MPKPSAKRIQAGWIAFGIACAFALLGMAVSPRAIAEGAPGATMPMQQIYMTALCGILTLAAAVISAVLLLRLRRITRLRNLAILMMILVLALIGLFEVNWARGLL